MTREICEDCGRECGTEEEVDSAFDPDEGNLTPYCFADVLFDGDTDPDCDRRRHGRELGEMRAEADRNRARAEAAEEERDEARHDYRVVETAIRTLGFPVVEAGPCVKAIETLAKERDEARAIIALHEENEARIFTLCGVTVEDVAGSPVEAVSRMRARLQAGWTEAANEREAAAKEVARLREALADVLKWVPSYAALSDDDADHTIMSGKSLLEWRRIYALAAPVKVAP